MYDEIGLAKTQKHAAKVKKQKKNYRQNFNVYEKWGTENFNYC